MTSKNQEGQLVYSLLGEMNIRHRLGYSQKIPDTKKQR